MGAGVSSSSSEAPKERRASTCKLARQLSQTDFAEGLPDFLDEDDLRHLLKDKFNKAKFDAVKSDIDELVSREQLIKLVEEWRQSMIVDALGSATLQNIDVENIMTTYDDDASGDLNQEEITKVFVDVLKLVFEKGALTAEEREYYDPDEVGDWAEGASQSTFERMDLNGDGRIQHAELKEFVLSGEFANAVAEASPLDSKSLDKLLGTRTRSTGGGGGEAPAPAAPAVAEAPAPAAV